MSENRVAIKKTVSTFEIFESELSTLARKEAFEAGSIILFASNCDKGGH